MGASRGLYSRAVSPRPPVSLRTRVSSSCLSKMTSEEIFSRITTTNLPSFEKKEFGLVILKCKRDTEKKEGYKIEDTVKKRKSV